MTYAILFSNKPETKSQRIQLRKNQTKAERELWLKIRNRQLLGYKFRRQYNIDYYIVDFYCHELKLIIELDGYVHGEDENISKDIRRENYLKDKGYSIIRYRNEQIKYEMDAVLQDIINHINQITLNYETSKFLPL